MKNFKNYKSGFISIIGNPNAGKSTLINSLVKKKISIVTNKAQTTRKKIIGIINKNNYQLIFEDTPGIIKVKYLLHKIMYSYIKESIYSSDLILYVVSIEKKYYFYDFNIINILKKKKIPLLILINKIDKIKNEKQLENIIFFYHKIFPENEILPISSLKNINIDLIIYKILKIIKFKNYLQYDDKNLITNQSLYFICSELIREKIFFIYKKEIPYSTEVTIEKIEKKDKKIFIYSLIYIERKSQKKILISYKGKNIKKLINFSKIDIQKNIFNNNFKVKLKINIKIIKDWKLNINILKYFKYLN
ncbi:GTPase Era [Candidatus Shikimatogenerans silvanidophilus]|uniref:GTPase Era n=1 Tax=Candidatus Shikimatogenerans silvanidophilus TaxID=2782547 RepID=UPI001BA7945B|nr:GTPase Era [Candidatus Shikimatogenerans silvanidophilus]